MSKRSRSRADRHAAHQAARRSGTNQGLSLIIIALVALIAFANALPDNLAWDDVMFAAGNRPASVSLAQIGNFFTSDVWAAMGKDTGLYRPLLLVSIALDIQLFGDWYVGYHLVNILLHVLASLAVFGLVRYLLPVANGAALPVANHIALLAALIFAVHPVHTEVVNSIFNRSDMLVTVGVAGGLWWFLPAVERQPRKAWAVLSLLCLLVLLCKETGIALPAVAVVTLFLTAKGNWQTRLRKCFPAIGLLIPVGIYFALRVNALGGADVPVIPDETLFTVANPANALEGVAAPSIPDETLLTVANPANAPPGQQPIGLHFDLRNLIPAIKVWFDSLVLLLWPHPLLAFHARSASNLIVALSVQLAILAYAIICLKRKSPGFFIGLAFFYCTILPSSRIISESGSAPHLAERYLYLPSVGLIIVLAFGLSWLVRRFSLRTAVLFVMTAAVLLTPLTWARNSEWASTVRLAQSDYQKGRREGKNLKALVTALFFDGELARAKQLCDKHAEALPRNWSLSATCGQVYENLKRFDKAEKAYLLALNHDRGKASAHYSLANLYLHTNRSDQAKEQFEQAIAKEKQHFMKELLSAEMLMRLYPTRKPELLEAKDHLDRALQLQPQFHHAQTRLNDLNEMLEALPGQRN